jgi:hypothetical protein
VTATECSFAERRLRLEWVELGERVARAMGMRKEYCTKTHRHWMAPCDVCGEPTLVAQERPCRMTPGCSGRHRKPQPQEIS